MKKTRKILSIGDIHGRNAWKIKLFGSISDFEFWAREVHNGAHEAFEQDYPLHQWDKVIFVGDYVDSFNISNVEMLQNLRDIILLKETYPEKIVLLIGNHDVHYIIPDQYCSGYRPEMKHDFGQIFNDNLTKFQLAYFEDIPEYEGRKNRKVLWTHAGVTGGWLKILNESFTNERHRHYQILKEFADARIDRKLNLAWETRLSSLFLVDSYSGGMSQWAGPLWVRPGILEWEAIEGFDQIVGHTPKRSITKIWCPDESTESNPNARDLIVLIDCLEHGDGTYHEISYEYEEN
jgi:hypothetical protein